MHSSNTAGGNRYVCVCNSNINYYCLTTGPDEKSKKFLWKFLASRPKPPKNHRIISYVKSCCRSNNDDASSFRETLFRGDPQDKRAERDCSAHACTTLARRGTSLHSLSLSRRRTGFHTRPGGVSHGE